MTISPTAERERLRDALLDLCFEFDFQALGLDDLLARAGVGEAEFHRSFTDLEDCFCAVLQAQTDELMMRVAATFATDQGWRDRLRAVSHEMLRFLREDPRRAWMMAVVSPAAGERSRLIRDQGMQALIELIDQGCQEMADSSSLSRFTAETLGSAIYERMRVMIERRDFDALPSLCPELMYSAVLPYLGPEVATEELTIPAPSSAADSGDPRG